VAKFSPMLHPARRQRGEYLRKPLRLKPPLCRGLLPVLLNYSVVFMTLASIPAI
jgi:hypothetical protein